ncbi:glycoside hydrolase [Tissierellia bacterium S5-A11]|nr:glycoside hydrolase [Tissierellia bacterium S5-A11]
MMVGIRRWTCMAMFLMVPMAVGATYHPGDIGEDISTIQHRLGTLGYHLEADGVYGPATEDAIREFQAAHGLEADGLVGPATYRALLSRDIPTSRGDFSTLLVRRLISVAQEYIGVPYLFGGSTPSGFDCSGFVQFAAKAAGLVLPRSADEQYHMGRSVSRSQMQPGDLVFFSTYTDGVSHSGIYLGGDRFISSTSSRGVVIDSLSEGYWSDCYVGAKRLI